MCNIYDWTLHWAKTKNSNYALFGIAFIENSFFSVPPDVLLIPLIIAEPEKWRQKVLICAADSVCGTFSLVIMIGKVFYKTIGLVIVNFYNLHNAMAIIGEKYANNAFLSIFAGAFTPTPYKAIMITA